MSIKQKNPGSSGSAGHTIQDEGTPLTARTNLNFVGAGVAATDDAGNNATKITIGSTSPGGSDTQIQFNDSSAFGGDAGLTYNKTTDALTVAGALSAGAGNVLVQNVAASYGADVTPTMTNWTTPSGEVTFSTEYAGGSYPSWKLFDKITNTGTSGWFAVASYSNPEWVAYQFASAKTITKYTITTWDASQGSGAYAPKDWTFQGSNDGAAWTTLDTRSSQTGWGGNDTRTFTFTNTTAYLYYKLNITAGNDATYLGFNELTMHESVYVWSLGVGGTPAYTLDVVGDINFTGTIYDSGVALSYVPYSGATGNVNLNTRELSNVSQLGIGVVSPTYDLDITGTSASEQLPLVKIRDERTTTTTDHNYVFQINRQASDTPCVLIGNDGNANTILSNNGGNIRIGPYVAAVGQKDVIWVDFYEKVGIGGVTSPTARLHVVAGTATANTAPIKLNSGTVLTTPEAGAIEFDGTDFFMTI
jgi:hypothetical protein